MDLQEYRFACVPGKEEVALTVAGEFIEEKDPDEHVNPRDCAVYTADDGTVWTVHRTRKRNCVVVVQLFTEDHDRIDYNLLGT